MTEQYPARGPRRGQWRRVLLWTAALGVTLVFWPAALPQRAGQTPTGPQPNQDVQYRRELLSYVSGLVLALALTGLAFGMVNWSAVVPFWLYVTVGACALVQMIVHFRFFLHVSFEQKREDLQLILFSTLILTVMVGGTIWILSNLALRMH
jgi:cytochrome o ubiquinol oxidase subunit IV